MIARLMPLLLLATSAALATPATHEIREIRQAHASAKVVLKVVHLRRIQQALVARTRELGGHVASMTHQQLVLKLPPAGLPTLLGELPDHGRLLSKSISREDLSQQLRENRIQLQSKTDILGRLRAFFGTANVGETLSVERNLMGLVAELERVKGQLRYLDDRVRFARLQIDFQIRERAKTTYVRSPFDWVNGVDLESFLYGF